MEWTVHGERWVYDNEWMRVALVDVELPSGARFEHHVLRMPAQASGVVVDVPDRGVLLLWRHRFITDTWGWELPAGRVDVGETPIEAGARETLEETGWQPGPLEPMITYYPHNGTSDTTFNLFVATSATQVGDPADPDESERVEWVSWDTVRSEIAVGRIRDGMSLTGLLYRLAQI
jgi:8-oxo-dGTP pyrophosphatase MutT (NUDIX family)